MSIDGALGSRPSRETVPKPLRFTFRVALAIAVAASTLACNIDVERRTIVTRDQFGERWPLAVNSAVVECSRDGSVAVLKVGTKRYALNDKARERGLPDASEVSRIVPILSGRPVSGTAFADTDELGTVCRS